MRALASTTIALAIVTATAIAAQRPQVDNSGGRDVTVALFSTHDVHDVMLAPLGTGSWTAECTACAHHPLIAPIHFNGPNELFGGGLLRVTDTASGEQRSAAGLWHLKSIAGSVDIVLALPSEHYVAAVLSAETEVSEPAESLRAMAIVARTYALNGPHYAAAAGHLKADLCDSTECQAVRFGAVSSTIEQAVWDTAGETLWFGRHRADVYFSQSCGGMTEDAHTPWPTISATPYLVVHPDPYCLLRSASAWHAEVKLTDLQSIAKVQGWRLPAEIVSVSVTKRSSARRALLLEFAGRNGIPSQISASSLRLAIGRALGWNKVRSDWYEVGVRNEALIFDGRGFGHGVGLCQFGAIEMAREHKSTHEILAFYLPGTRLGIGPDDAGWIGEEVTGITVRSVAQITSKQREEVESSWQQARALFPPRTPITPEIAFAPSPELFRQMTSQPGWMLASTAGSRIVLNAMPMVATQLHTTLRHEMLHALVESEVSAKSPLWLREGLVAVLDGEPSGDAMSSAAIDAELSHPTTREASERAHRAAAAKVQTMISRYGIAQVRGWLVSGVAASAN